jgi:glutathione S-transferase
MFKVTVYPGAFGEPTASPFCIKSLCMLHAANVPYEVIETPDPRKAPRSKLPFVEINGRMIPDSEDIRAAIEAEAEIDFDEGLTDEQRAVSRAVIRMMEEHVYFAILADRWGEDDNWAYVRDAFFSDIPKPIRGIVTHFIRKQAIAQLNGQGLGRFTPEERFDRVRRDIIAVRDLLADKPFLFGDTPKAADFSIVPMLRASIVTPVEKPLSRFIKNTPNLMDYVTRVTDKCYPMSI